MVNHSNTSVGKRILRVEAPKSWLRFWPYFPAIILVAGLVMANIHTDISTDQNGSLTLRSSLGNIAAASSALPTVTADEAQSANVATSVAGDAGLTSTDSVANKSTSMNAIVSLAQGDVSAANKPQIANASATANPITNYTTADGDTTSSIAAKFGISSQSVQQSNGLSSESVNPGTTLAIPAVDGVIYTLKPGDSLPDIANKYQSNLDDTLAINNLTTTNIGPGARVVLPDGVVPAAPAPAAATTTITKVSTTTTSYGSASAAQVGNRYAFGYCTYYAYNRRVALGLPVGSLWGNANTWAARAAASGFVVNHTPSAGAILQTTSGYYGHVGIVERVNADGSIDISEMNYAGWNRITSRHITDPGSYTYIH